MTRYDPDGNEKRRARKGERRCGECKRIIQWPEDPKGGWYCTGILADNDADKCCRTDYAGECAHFVRRADR